MVKMINKRLGNDMWVEDSRVDEYLTAGHRLAKEPKKPTAAKKPEPKKKRTKK